MSATAPEKSNGHDDATVLVTRGVDAIRASARDNRRRFLWTWAALAILAILLSASFLLGFHTAGEQNDLAQATADKAAKTSDDTLKYLQGEQGLPGVPGSNGVDGTPGLPGSTGETGPAGPKGETGERGATGPAGSVGPAGAAGPQGIPGAAGSGSAGPPGPAGAKGATGSKGSTGDRGATGAKGATGARGPAGATGPVGATGPPGPAGATSGVATSTAVGASANDTTTPKTANATCAPGLKVTGGGFALVPSDPGIIPTHTAPVGTNGWAATAEVLSLPPGTVWQLLVFAQCA